MMGYSRVGSQSLCRAFMHSDISGFFRRRFDLFAIDRLASQSFWGLTPVEGYPMLRRVALRGYIVGVVIGFVFEHRPSHAGRLICQGNYRDVWV